MRIIRYRDVEGHDRYGIVEGDRAYRAEGEPFSQHGLRRGVELGPAAALTLLPPVVPGKIVCVGLNYAAHVTENDPSRVVPDEPVLFMKPPSALIGAGQAIVIAHPDHRTDYEAELAIVIGRQGRAIAEADAPAFILGYTCGNDVSDRTLQKKDGQWVRAKGFDTYCPLGPWIETDFDPSDRAVVSRRNGDTKQSQRTSAMIFKPAFLVSFISDVMTLEPGDVILTGTPEGVGPMQPGDLIEVEIEGIGVLANPVVAAS
ncbi:MAG TPA: fumarylacetoacetate hydrolase family protein [Thermomicrobiales bacterium]|nr:fumarylacetoacetate hydrolase family protein [Thermomicrobiales bacterium]